MTVKSIFDEQFAETILKEIFTKHIMYSNATGIDNLDQYAFRAQLNVQVEILSRKILAGNYRFTKYKLKLISKGRNKVPRELGIPTVRDRIALRSLCNFLTIVYKHSIEFQLPQTIVNSIKNELVSGKYDGCIKLDVANFYPSIRHKELIKRLGSKIRNPEIKDVVLSAISSPIVSRSRKTDTPSSKGVPQGLAISNILAAIYLSNIDRHLKSIENIRYYRYVDDVLIFCDLTDAEEIAKQVIGRFKKIGLTIHDPIKSPEKSSIGPLVSGFDYLGYKFHGNSITARKSSVERLKESLVSIFTSYKYSKLKSEEFLLWRLNLRIAGCVYENKSKGWLFFYAEINDEQMLHTLDHYVKKLIGRFNVNITPKKFVRAFKELSHRKYETKYIPNFDQYTLSEMRAVLVDYFQLNLHTYSDKDIEFAFRKRLTKQIKDLQMDIMDFSYT